MENHKKLLDNLKNKKSYILFIIGRNGSGKTTLMNDIRKQFNKEEIKLYTINENNQFTSPNPFDPKQYKEVTHSKIMSTGESLFNELTTDLEKDIKILDEPTATLDLKKTSLIIEAFIRDTSKIKIISSNDYISLKLLASYNDIAYNVETGKMEKISDFLNKIIDETIKELKKSPFQEIKYNNYIDLKI